MRTGGGTGDSDADRNRSSRRGARHSHGAAHAAAAKHVALDKLLVWRVELGEALKIGQRDRAHVRVALEVVPVDADEAVHVLEDDADAQAAELDLGGARLAAGVRAARSLDDVRVVLGPGRRERGGGGGRGAEMRHRDGGGGAEGRRQMCARASRNCKVSPGVSGVAGCAGVSTRRSGWTKRSRLLLADKPRAVGAWIRKVVLSSLSVFCRVLFAETRAGACRQQLMKVVVEAGLLGDLLSREL